MQANTDFAYPGPSHGVPLRNTILELSILSLLRLGQCLFDVSGQIPSVWLAVGLRPVERLGQFVES